MSALGFAQLGGVMRSNVRWRSDSPALQAVGETPSASAASSPAAAASASRPAPGGSPARIGPAGVPFTGVASRRSEPGISVAARVAAAAPPEPREGRS